MVDRKVQPGLETDPVQAGGEAEDRLDAVFQAEIGFELLGAQIEMLRPVALGPEGEVPWLHLRRFIPAFPGPGEQLRHLGPGGGQRGGHQALEQPADGGNVLRHPLLQDVVGPAGVAEQLRDAAAQIGDLQAEPAVVVRPAQGPAVVGAPHPFPQLGARTVLQEGDVAGMREIEHPARTPFLPGGLCTLLTQESREPFELGLVAQFEGEGVGLVEYVLAVSQLQQGEFFFQPAVDLLVGGGEQRAAAHEAFVAVFEQFALVGRQVEGVPLRIDFLHPGEERFAERDIHLVLGQQGREFLGQLLHRIVALGLQQVEEDAAHPVQFRSGELQRLDGVLEGGRPGVGDDGVHLGLGPGDGLPEGRQVVLQTDGIEARGPVGEPGRNQQGIVHNAKITINEDFYSIRISLILQLDKS